LTVAALILGHLFIAWSAVNKGLRLADVTWLYWYGACVLGACSAWRMHRSLSTSRGEAAWTLAFFCALQAGLGVLLLRTAGMPAWSAEAGIALAWIAANSALDLRRHLAFDELEAPDLTHFLGLWMARLLPFGLMFALPLAFPTRDFESERLLIAFLAGVAGVDIVLQRIGPSFGRTLTVWQRRRATHSSNNYLKWYKPSEWKDR
jgi:hypothetical protein